MSLTGSCLWVRKGHYCHYFFLVKCLLQTRCHMGGRAPPLPAGPSTTVRGRCWMEMLPGVAQASERLWCTLGWQRDLQPFSAMPQSHFKSLSDANPVVTSWLWSLYLFLWEAQHSTPVDYFLRVQICAGMRGRARDKEQASSGSLN